MIAHIAVGAKKRPLFATVRAVAVQSQSFDYQRVDLRVGYSKRLVKWSIEKELLCRFVSRKSFAMILDSPI
jgi:hypothetical protein